MEDEVCVRTEFDNMIGRLDRVISELMVHRDNVAALDEADRQTLKHHSDDMIGVGQALLTALSNKVTVVTKVESRVEPEPKYGSRVRVIEVNTAWSNGLKVGDEGVIDIIDEDDPAAPYRVVFANDSRGWAQRVEVIT